MQNSWKGTAIAVLFLSFVTIYWAFIFINMTIDLSIPSGILYFAGPMPSVIANATNANLRMCLYSKYSNKAILNGANINGANPYFGITKLASTYNSYYSLLFSATNADLINKDVQGYYNMEIDYQQAPNVWVNAVTKLVKVINSWDRADQNAWVYGINSYPNEGNQDNEQYIFFRQ